MKKLIVLPLIAATALGLTACKGSETATVSNDANLEAPAADGNLADNAADATLDNAVDATDNSALTNG